MTTNPNRTTPPAETAKKTTHTPGPWTTHHLEVWTANGTGRGSDIMVAKVVGDTDDMMDSGALADARLIAQAPAMLDVIRRLAGLDIGGVTGITPVAPSSVLASRVLEARAILAAIDGSAR